MATQVLVVFVAAALVALVAVAGQVAPASAPREEQARLRWQFEEARQGVCRAIESHVIDGCRVHGPDLLQCCARLAAYEATACPCELKKTRTSTDFETVHKKVTR